MICGKEGIELWEQGRGTGRSSPPAKLDALVGLLVVSCLTCHAQRPTPLVRLLASDLGVDLRRHWTPDTACLAGFRKGQLAHLLGELHGPLYDPKRETRKKSEMVGVLAGLFADAASGRLPDKKLEGRANAWLSSVLRATEQPGE